MQTGSLWQDEWVRDVGMMVGLWFVALTISSAALLLYGDALLTLLG